MEKESHSPPSIRLLIGIVAPAYWFFLAILYSGNYWRSFGINVLEFASLSDLLQISIFPIVSSVIAIVLGTLLGNLPRDLNDGRLSGKALIGLITIFGVMILVSFRVGVLVAVFLGYIYLMNRISSFRELYENPNVRGTVLWLLVLVVPLWAYMGGENNADRALRSNSYTYALIDGVEHRYLGILGGYAFLAQLNPDRVLILNLGASDSLQLFKSRGFPDNTPNFIRWWFEPDDAGALEESDDEQSPAPEGELAGDTAEDDA